MALALLVGFTFRAAAGNQFVYDDFQYLVANPDAQHGLTPAALGWAFTSLSASNGHPVTWLSHLFDVSLFGLEPRGPHVVNILLHAANAVLLFLVLGALTKAHWKSAMVAALFAVHPAHVESVAWISERKDLLSCLFLLLAIRAHQAYAERPGAWRYAAVAALYAAGLMSKPMLVTFPILLLILDRWPLQRWRRGELPRLVLEKVPLLAMAAVSGWLTVLAQREGGRCVRCTSTRWPSAPPTRFIPTWPTSAICSGRPD